MDSLYSRLNPFPATLLENRLLSRPGSDKEIRHFVFDISGSGMSYHVGQSLGVYATNLPAYVDELISAGGWSGSEDVMLPKALAPVTLRHALTHDLHLSWLTRKLLEHFHAHAADPAQKEKLLHMLSPTFAEQLQKSFDDRFPIDFLREFSSAKISPQQFVDSLKKLNPRLYSISSSHVIDPQRISLTVNIARCTACGCQRAGTCSTFLADRLPIGGKAPVFVADAPFGLTPDDAAPIIMVGPGTGIAPFRAFLAERAARKATGRNWLFFGDRRRAYDFLYEDEILAHQASGLLTRLDLAWSRDGAEKIYVQNLIEKSSAEIWAWLQAGAILYICGDKQMGRGVEGILTQIVRTHGQTDDTAAAEYLSMLKKTNRYQKDVY